MNGEGIVDELIQCTSFEGDNLVGKNVLLTKNGVEVLDELHRYQLVGQLIIDFIQKPSKLKVQD